MNAWKIERRRRTFELKALGWKQRDIAEAFGVSEAAVSNIVQSINAGHDQFLKEYRP